MTDEKFPVPAGLDAAGPELRALLHGSRGTAEFAPGGGGDLDLAQRDLDSALHLARTHGFAYSEVQILCTLSLLAASRCDYGRMIGAAEEAVRVASRHGRHPSADARRCGALRSGACCRERAVAVRHSRIGRPRRRRVTCWGVSRRR